MKKMIVVFSMVVVVSLVVTSHVMAYSFIDVEGFVNPGAAVEHPTDGTKTFKQVDFSFKVTDSRFDLFDEMDWLKLYFPKNVFSSVGDMTIINPDWNDDSGSAWFDTYFYVKASSGWNGTKVGVNEMLSFSVSEVTVNPMHEPSWNLPFSWSVFHIPIPTGFDGTTPTYNDTTTPTPEPGTFLLLGSGMAGVVFYVRRKKCLLNI